MVSRRQSSFGEAREDHHRRSAKRVSITLIALAEAAYVVERGRTAIASVSDLIDRVIADSRIEIYPVTFSVFQRSLTLGAIPELHDRLIVVTALEVQEAGHEVALVTKDSVISPSGLVRIVW
jgi:PIN domain nuclease of toxin-antitoxin system